MIKYFLLIFLLAPLFVSSMEEADYEKWVHNIYLKHYKDPVSNSEWNSRIQNIPKQYKLKYKDNLWDLSGSFLRDSLFWSKLWVTNPQVENPHLIYKDNFIKFDPLALSQVNKSKLSVDIQEQFPGLVVPQPFVKSALSKDQIPSSLPNIPIFSQFEDEIDLKQLRRTYREETKPIPFYLSDSLPSSSGEILGKDGYGNFFGVSGEKVILKLDDNVPIGTYFTVFKNKGRTGGFFSNLVGQGREYEIQVKGLLKIVSYIQGSGSLYKARVITAMDQMSIEDSIFRGSPNSYDFSDKKTAKGEGFIIGSPYKTRLFLTTGSVVFLNKGTKDGLYKSVAFYIRPSKESGDFFERPYNYEGAILGRLKVIHVIEDKATAVILSARDKIYIGDSFAGQISAEEVEKIEDGDIVEEGQNLLMDFEEIDPDSLKSEEEPKKEEELLKERENIDFETLEQEEILEDPVEKDEQLMEGFEELDSNELDADFEIEEEDGSAKEERLEDYEKDKNTEEYYEVDSLEWNEDLSKGKKKVKKLNKEIKEQKEELETLDEDLHDEDLKLQQLENETLEDKVKQGIEENEDFEFGFDSEEVELIEDEEELEKELLEEEGFEEIEDDEEELEEEEEEEELEDDEEELEDDEEELEEDFEEPRNELEEFEEIDTL